MSTASSADWGQDAAGGMTSPQPVQLKLSILMPALNEAATIESVVRRVLSVEYPCPVELIVVDDGSTDATAAILRRLREPRLRVIQHRRNRGKGAAVRSAAEQATGSYMIIFDADLEYSPADIVRVLEPVVSRRALVVYGTRLFGNNTVYQSYKYAVGNRVMTTAANLLYNSALTDLHTCLKLYPRDLFLSLACDQDGFGLDTQVTARALRAGVRPFEVPISYHSRNVEDGKKISWRHGVESLRILASERRRDAGAWLPIAKNLARDARKAMYSEAANSSSPTPNVVAFPGR